MQVQPPLLLYQSTVRLPSFTVNQPALQQQSELMSPVLPTGGQYPITVDRKTVIRQNVLAVHFGFLWDNDSLLFISISDGVRVFVSPA